MEVVDEIMQVFSHPAYVRFALHREHMPPMGARIPTKATVFTGQCIRAAQPIPMTGGPSVQKDHCGALSEHFHMECLTV